MVSEKLKNAIAKANGLDESRKVEIIRTNIRKEFPHSDDEIALLRKAIAYLFELISNLHEGELNNKEFAEYNALVEQIKIDAKESLK